MKKHLFLPIFLGLLFNTIFFAQTSVPDAQDDAEVTIERTIIDEEGNASTVTITRKGKAVKGKQCKKIMAYASSHGYSKPRVRMGVELTDVDEGIRIDRVVENSAASQGGLQRGDVIVAINKEPLADYNALRDILADKEEGDRIKVRYIRDGKKKNAVLVLQKNLRHPDYKHLNCGYLNKPCLGVNYRSANAGVRISGVIENSGAEAAGIQRSDRILSVNGEMSNFGSQFDRIIKAQEPGTTVALAIDRAGEQIKMNAEIGLWDACGVCRLMTKEDEAVKEAVEKEAVALLSQELELMSFDMYPVPATEELTVSFVAEEAPVQVAIIDVSGKTIAKEEIVDFSGSFTKTYKLADATRGMALITITQNGKTTTRQALIQ